ncbi:MAG: magnesium transporter CorA family protein [Anaerolineae bacterium]|nr:magnesium transporter CorA family protein [Anaerolineae bacterium]
MMKQEAKQGQPMIRSLVAAFDEEKQELVVRRNPTREKLAQAIADGAKAWIDIVDSTTDEVNWLADIFKLGPAVVEDLLRADRRPTLMVYASYLFLSLFEPQIKGGVVQGQEIHCVITDSCFITVRPSGAETVESAYERVAHNPDAWNAGVSYFLYLTAQQVIDAYYPLLDRISNQLNGLEEKLLDSPANAKVNDAMRKPVYRVKQQLINLRQMVAPQREVISNVIGEKRLGEDGSTRDLFRHLYERLLRVYDVIDSQRDLSSNVLDMMQNQQSRRMVEAVNRLTIFSMIFLPLTFLSGLLELNFATTTDAIVLPISGGMMLFFVLSAMVLSSGMMVLMFRRRGWL